MATDVFQMVEGLMQHQVVSLEMTGPDWNLGHPFFEVQFEKVKGGAIYTYRFILFPQHVDVVQVQRDPYPWKPVERLEKITLIEVREWLESKGMKYYNQAGMLVWKN